MANRWIIPNTLLHRVLILTWLAIGLVNAVTEPISIKGTKFFYPNGTQFFIKGVVYSSSLNPELDQYTGTQDAAVDVLADIHACSRDASYLSWLGVNTVSTLFLDWSRSHALCFEQFAEYDIWVIPLLQSGNTAINSTNPSWNTTIYDVYQQAVDEVSKYNNTLAIFAGYENVANVTNTGAYAAVKAAARDTKAYMRSKNYREIPVGYGFADITNEDHQLATIDYLTCGPPEETADFIAIESYAWCGNSTYTQSGWKQLTETFQQSTVPVFLSEFGCKLHGGNRTFSEVPTLYGPQMAPVWSGGIAYEYFNYSSGYGLISIDDGDVDTNAQYSALSSRYSTVTPSTTSAAGYTPTASKPTSCDPPAASASFSASPTLPPLPYPMLCDCMFASLECVMPTMTAASLSYTAEDLAGYCENYPLDCVGIRAIANNGTYGPYSMCSLQQQLSYYINMGFLDENRDPSSCSSSGERQTPNPPNATCDGLLKQAGVNGTGTITSYPAGTTPTPGPNTGDNGNTLNTNGTSSGMSTGAKAGTGIGVSVGALAVIGVLGVLLMRRQKKAKAARDAKDYDGKPELDATEVKDAEKVGLAPTVLDGTEQVEMEGSQPKFAATLDGPAELADPNWIVEMPADERYRDDPSDEEGSGATDSGDRVSSEEPQHEGDDRRQSRHER